MLTTRFWNQQVGLLPVNFLHKQDDERGIYAMLNGSSHNFCFCYDQIGMDDASFRSKVWSANMTAYMTVSQDMVTLYDISRPEASETINASVIERDFKRFYSYLTTKSLRREDGVLELILNKFREIRSVLREEDGARQSLSILLYILSQFDGVEGFTWELPDNVNESIDRFSRENVVLMANQLKEGLRGLGFRPNTDMILRHCSGALFQEANFIAHFPPQLSLFPSVNYSSEKNPNLVGAYFTPAYIARAIVEESLKHIDWQHKDSLTIFDPACGSGVFLSECLRQLKTLKYAGSVNVIGWDIDQIAIDMSNYMLSFEKNEWGDRLSYSIENHNSLDAENSWPECDMILMNPPFISWSLMNDDQRQDMTALFGGNSGRPNLSIAFYYKASQALKEDGVLGSLMPSAFLQLDMISDIRQEINRRVPPVLIGQLGSYVFDSAFVDVSMIVAKKNTYVDRTQYLWTRNSNKVSEEALRALRCANANARETQSSDDYNIYMGDINHARRRDSWIPLSCESVELAQNLEIRLCQGRLITAENLFDIKQGARTGANKVFVLNQEEYKSLPKKEREYFKPSIDNDAIQSGKLNETNYIFFPYPYENGFVDENDLVRKMPIYYEKWLLPNKGKLQGRSKIDVNKWWLLTWPRKWQYESRPKLVSTEFGKAGSFSIDTTGEFVVERGLCWLPKEDMSLSKLCFYMAILNSEFFNELLMLYSKQLAGGVFNLETKHVNDIPLPIYNYVPENIREAITQYGKYMLSGIKYKDDQLYELVRRLYA